jgi:hypothetical protein
MAGLYIVAMTLIFGLFGVVAATITSITLIARARKRLPPGLRGRGTFLTACGLAPFVGLAWLVGALFIHVQISNKLAHQDCGFSGDPYVTLPNGYVLGSLNTYDGYIRDPASTRTFQSTAPDTCARSLISSGPTVTSSAPWTTSIRTQFNAFPSTLTIDPSRSRIPVFP